VAIFATAFVVAACNSTTVAPPANGAPASAAPTATASATVTAAPTPPPTATPNPVGSFKVTVANVGEWNYEGPGTYSGDTAVDCNYYNGAWTADLHDPGPGGVDHVWMVTIEQHAPQSVTVDTTFLTQGRQWQVLGNGPGSGVQITVQDTGKAVTLTAHGTSVHETVDATLECSMILRD
jgi:hypothetical protein